jgi:hypothetical protein
VLSTTSGDFGTNTPYSFAAAVVRPIPVDVALVDVLGTDVPDDNGPLASAAAAMVDNTIDGADVVPQRKQTDHLTAQH